MAGEASNVVKTYHVVEFLDDKTTYAIPQWWILKKNDGLYGFWPPYSARSQVIGAIKRRESPSLKRKWTLHPMRIMHSYSTLEEALSKVPTAEVTSNLDSDVSDARRPRAKRLQMEYHSDSSSEVEMAANKGPGLPAFPVTDHRAAPENMPRVSHQLQSPQSIDRAHSAAPENAPRVYLQLESPHRADTAHSGGPVLGVYRQPENPHRSERAQEEHALHPQAERLQELQSLGSQPDQWNFHNPAGNPFEEYSSQVTPAGAVDHCHQLFEMMRDEERRNAAFREVVLRSLSDVVAQVTDMRRHMRGTMGGAQAAALPEDCPLLPVQTTGHLRALDTYLGDKEKMDLVIIA